MKIGKALSFIFMCVAIAVAALAFYVVEWGPPTGSTTVASQGPAGPSAPPTSWPDYSVNGPGFVVPDLPDGGLIAYGYELVARTFGAIGPEVGDPAMRFAGNSLACQNCHLDGGTNRTGLPLVGVFKTYPKFLARDGHVVSLPERLNDCMTRSMNGRKLPDDSRQMAALLAYMRFIGDPPPVYAEPAPPASLPAEAGRGAEVFATVCAACHQANGLGLRWGSVNDGRGYRFPPLWGPDSFNDGAGMDQYQHIVGFVYRNMPRGVDPVHPQLSLQQAWDVASYVLAMPRPHDKAPR
jgi:thiosulfate dehydrogenase